MSKGVTTGGSSLASKTKLDIDDKLYLAEGFNTANEEKHVSKTCRFQERETEADTVFVSFCLVSYKIKPKQFN